ncbi:A/G-specific DNA-adenine glycosylase [Jezberella montanilacus]|uniref:Adenine DNA glycosylase n=1 Tax=Jezberella montanilacus TaxID=323426 RepID=A0A2T0XCS6_9BURK|nr:A/G-specific DNA-adenine glycosylase [Jezberella montanilacus]
MQGMKIAPSLIPWQRQHGRHGLPWQTTRDPYRVWLSEIMLQQTQVTTVLRYYAKFLENYPDVAALAQASSQEVMSLWAGLGYYARGRNLHACAQKVMTEWRGQFPNNAADLVTLPGIGPSTAAAIASFCFAERVSILDGNVKRVFARYFAIEGDTDRRQIQSQLWDKANAEIPSKAYLTKDPQAMTAYTQGLMDLGATLCTRNKPRCDLCPLQAGCVAYAQGRTSELPTPKTRRALPEKSTCMLIVYSEGRLLLERRPETGIWGGLWSLPEIENNQREDIEGHSHSNGYSITRQLTMASIQHVFTHFKLHITPILIQAKKSHSDWINIASIEHYGLPTPVKKILAGLIDQAVITS